MLANTARDQWRVSRSTSMGGSRPHYVVKLFVQLLTKSGTETSISFEATDNEKAAITLSDLAANAGLNIPADQIEEEMEMA